MEPLFAIVGTILAVMLGWLVGLFSQPVRDFLFGPKFSLTFEASEHGYVSDTLGGKYIRLRVKNTGRSAALGCKGYSVRCEIEKNGEFRIVEKCAANDTLLLSWAYSQCDDHTAGFDMCRGVGRFLDLVQLWPPDMMTITVPDRFVQLCCVTTEKEAPEVKKLLGKDINQATYRFYVQIAANNAKAKLYSVTLKLKWDNKGWEVEPIDFRPVTKCPS